MSKFWMIANIANANPSFYGYFLDMSRAPRFMHYEKETAELELLRLQRKYPFGEFILLESIALAEATTAGLLRIESIEI